MKVIAVVAQTGYSDGPYFRAVAGDVLPEGVGRNGGARERLIVLGRETPAWFVPAVRQLPPGAEVELRIVCAEAGRKTAVGIPAARNPAELKSFADSRVKAREDTAAVLNARRTAEGQRVLAEQAARVMGPGAIEVEPGLWLGEDGQEWALPEVPADKVRMIGYMVLDCGSPAQAGRDAARWAPRPRN